jgi:Tfp pilus assembly protein PilN
MRAVNLLPKDVSKQRRITAQQVPALVGVGLAIVVTLVLAMGFLSASQSVKQAQGDLDQAQAELSATPQPPAAPTAQATQLAQEQSARLAALSTALGGRLAWDRILREFSLVLPDDVWLSNLTLSTPVGGAADQSFSIGGYTYSHDSVARLLSRLQLIPELTNVVLTSSQRQGSTTSTVQFQINASVTGPAGAVPAAAVAPVPVPVAPASTDTTATTPPPTQ